MEDCEPVHQLDIVASFLPKPKPGSMIILFVRCLPPPPGQFFPPATGTPRSARHRSAGRPASSRARPCDASARPADLRCSKDACGAIVVGERGHVIDDPRAGFDRCRHDVSLARVHRTAAPPAASWRMTGTYALDPSPSQTGLAPGLVDFAAYIDNRGAFGDHVRAALSGRRGVYKPPAIGEAVGITLRMPMTCG